MSKVKPVVALIPFLVIATMLGGILLISVETKDKVPPEPTSISNSIDGFGITYLPITQGLSEYYGLNVTYGGLITEVIPGSPADLSGLQAGDVILAFDGARLDEDSPLLGMIMTHPAGRSITLEISRMKTNITMVLSHREKSPQR